MSSLKGVYNMLEQLKEEVYKANLKLKEYNLVNVIYDVVDKKIPFL